MGNLFSGWSSESTPTTTSETKTTTSHKPSAEKYYYESKPYAEKYYSESKPSARTSNYESKPAGTSSYAGFYGDVPKSHSFQAPRPEADHYRIAPEMVNFYHYTDHDGLQAIRGSQYIQQSTGDWVHARFGEGVYGTKLSPSYGRKHIAWNNWRRGGHSNQRRGRADYAVKVRIPQKKIREHNTKEGRNVYYHQGQLNLNLYQHEFLAVSVP